MFFFLAFQVEEREMFVEKDDSLDKSLLRKPDRTYIWSVVDAEDAHRSFDEGVN